MAEWLERVGRGFKSRNSDRHDVVLGSPEFNFSSTLVNSQLVCLTPVGILKLVMFICYYLFILILKAPLGSDQLCIRTHECLPFLFS